jgi:hypothetical protein
MSKIEKPKILDPVPYEGCGIATIEYRKIINEGIKMCLPYIEQCEAEPTALQSINDVLKTEIKRLQAFAQYIVDSPSPENGGFSDILVKNAKFALTSNPTIRKNLIVQSNSPVVESAVYECRSSVRPFYSSPQYCPYNYNGKCIVNNIDLPCDARLSQENAVIDDGKE